MIQTATLPESFDHRLSHSHLHMRTREMLRRPIRGHGPGSNGSHQMLSESGLNVVPLHLTSSRRSISHCSLVKELCLAPRRRHSPSDSGPSASPDGEPGIVSAVFRRSSGASHLPSEISFLQPAAQKKAGLARPVAAFGSSGSSTYCPGHRFHAQRLIDLPEPPPVGRRTKKNRSTMPKTILTDTQYTTFSVAVKTRPPVARLNHKSSSSMSLHFARPSGANLPSTPVTEPSGTDGFSPGMTTQGRQ